MIQTNFCDQKKVFKQKMASKKLLKEAFSKAIDA
jgi:hypothetical protein